MFNNTERRNLLAQYYICAKPGHLVVILRLMRYLQGMLYYLQTIIIHGYHVRSMLLM